MPRKRRLPKLCRHKTHGQYYVRINGKFHWLGHIDEPDAERKAEAKRVALLSELWSETLPIGAAPIEPGTRLGIAQLVERYMTERVQRYYRKPDGTPTSEQACIRCAVRPLVHLYGDLYADQFTPSKLEALQIAVADGSWMEGAEDWTVDTINKNVSRIRRCFAWAASKEIIPASVHHALTSVSPVPSGRGYARENAPVEAVPQAHIDAVEGLIPPVLWDVVQLQLLTGGRPGEILRLRAGDFDRSGKVWTAELGDHKTRHRGKSRVLLFGPKAQAILLPYLVRPADAYLFCSPRRDTHYTPHGYHRAITRACREAKVPHWWPHQLRHSAATRLQQEFGWDVARIICGHSSVSTTKQYVTEELARAVVAVQKSG